jgi:hypothetical protein
VIPKYTHASYSLGFEFKPEQLDPIVIKPKWWRRLFLREKVRVISVDEQMQEMSKKLAAAARQQEEEMLRRLFS